MSQGFAAVGEVLQSAGTVAILTHVRPDGDAIGSQLAMALALQTLGKTVTAWNEDGLPESFAFLAGSELITKPPDRPMEFDLVLALDTAAKDRLGTGIKAVRAYKTLVNIDHHASNPGYGDINYIDVKAPATGQIIYELLQDQKLPFFSKIADALFVAISTDTGSFRYQNTTAHTFEIAGKLVEAGVDLATVSNRVYESYPKRRILLLGQLLNDATFHANDRIATFSLTEATKAKLAIDPADIDGLIDVIRSVDSVVVAIFFEELPEQRVRISVRSKDLRIDANRICSTWGGGGHQLAAGARIRGTLEEVRTKVISYVSNEVLKYP
ncbi:MAG TPA: bifunctional oligoribonuclease/PAP phosphatase NrnA [Chthoniobacterales bacterium]|jgi:phosphoesterase RecJ-like protein|nr:bifunctional oligoribonuclease/PAP phosphatase NrnA [Chthoniobacterales bacterium]